MKKKRERKRWVSEREWDFIIRGGADQRKSRERAGVGGDVDSL
jgi:hypothetical protein